MSASRVGYVAKELGPCGGAGGLGWIKIDFECFALKNSVFSLFVNLTRMHFRQIFDTNEQIDLHTISFTPPGQVWSFFIVN